MPCPYKGRLALLLTDIPILEYYAAMARAATTADVFNAIGEPRRREIIGLLNDGQEWAVSDVVARVRITQPAVSKHLGVLRKVGVVTVVKRGQHRLYRLLAAQLKSSRDCSSAKCNHEGNSNVARSAILSTVSNIATAGRLANFPAPG